jgi:hypothetical protein
LIGEWTESRELAHVRGLIGWVGIPPRFQVVMYDQRLAVELIGYHTEDEIMSAVKSMRDIDAGLAAHVQAPRRTAREGVRLSDGHS